MLGNRIWKATFVIFNAVLEYLTQIREHLLSRIIVAVQLKETLRLFSYIYDDRHCDYKIRTALDCECAIHSDILMKGLMHNVS